LSECQSDSLNFWWLHENISQPQEGLMSTITVLGATGKTGRRVVDRLASAGHNVRAASRTPAGATPQVHPVHFDWDDVATYDAVVDGADGLYVIPPAFVVNHVDAVTALAKSALTAGVTKAVLLSARGVDADDNIPMRRSELAMLASGLNVTIIRPTWFAQNFSEGIFASALVDGVLAVPAAMGLEPFIDVDDVADVAAALLTESGHGEAAYDLSGSEAITFADAARILAINVGRPIEFIDAVPAQFIAQVAAAGVPNDYAAMLGGIFEVIRNGWDAHLSDGVQRVTGRPAQSFTQWAARTVRPLSTQPALPNVN
jgi:uncharacterized protein YbjT (DUF2867 family)